jgi:hypothetical protein
MDSRLPHQDARWLSEMNAAFDDRTYAGLRAWIDRTLPEIARERGWDESTTSGFRQQAFELGADSLLNVLFDDALKRLPRSLTSPTDLYLVQMGAATLNGFALRAPSGAAVVVLNHGLIGYIGHAVHVILGLTGMEPPVYCPHHSPQAFLRDLAALADGLVAGMPAILLPIDTVSCFDTGHHRANADLHHALCLLAEYFIVFHELGHVMLGHLDPDRSRRVVVEDVASHLGDVELIEPAHLDEIEADVFAYRQILEMAAGTALPPRDAAYAIGCVLVLMHVAEQTSGRPVYERHPPAVERWGRIRALLPADEPLSWTNSIDYLFEYLDGMRAASQGAS